MRYFFQIRDGSNLPDHEGIELPHQSAVRAEAIRLAGGTFADHARDTWDGTEWRLRVVDESGTVVFLARYSADDIGNGLPKILGKVLHPSPSAWNETRTRPALKPV